VAAIVIFSTGLLDITAPLIALAIPLLDTGLSIVRRFLCHQPIFGADRGHILHIEANAFLLAWVAGIASTFPPTEA
jgi:UDP-N-acetylmuramyl pentapeptide phosphotransferase/UDP-N-acetylglucosamine-1-phosphate transferase